jgi:hypothetical protein
MGKEKLVLLDGQHRIRSLEKLFDHIPDLRWNVVRVDIYTVESEQEAQGIYNIINSSKKVELYTGDVVPFIIPDVQRYFRDRYAEYCKTSKKPTGLNINLDLLAKHLIGKKVIEKLQLGIDGSEQLIERIKQLNQFYSDQPPSKFIEWGVKDYDKRYKELVESKDPFYLGLYRSYEWVDRLTEPFEEQEHKAIVVKRNTVPASLRNKLWEKRFGDKTQGECYCCKDIIRITAFSAAHIKSVRDGGDNSLDNLEPTCFHCNAEMGTMNLYDYKKLFH